MSATDLDDKASGMTEYERKMLALEERKLTSNTTWIAYVLWFFLGSFMVHRMYLGYVGSAVFWCLVFVAGVVMLGIGMGVGFGAAIANEELNAGFAAPVFVGGLLLFAWAVSWIVDLFRIPGMARNRKA